MLPWAVRPSAKTSVGQGMDLLQKSGGDRVGNVFFPLPRPTHEEQCNKGGKKCQFTGPGWNRGRKKGGSKKQAKSSIEMTLTRGHSIIPPVISAGNSLQLGTKGGRTQSHLDTCEVESLALIWHFSGFSLVPEELPIGLQGSVVCTTSGWRDSLSSWPRQSPWSLVI